MHFDSPLIQTLFYVLGGVAAVVLLVLGYFMGRVFASSSHTRVLANRERELFTAQKGFKTLYEAELKNLRDENDRLTAQLATTTQKVEDYRKKAAGFGGLFSHGRRAEAMYALLLENENLEEALHIQNDKLRQERVDALREQRRSAGHRRILISQLLNDRRIKNYISEFSGDEPHSQDAPSNSNALMKPANPDHHE
jgi:hypothetical protein